MFDKLPELIDPIYSVNHNKQFMGRVKQARLKRLAEVVESTDDRDILVQLEFFYDKALRFPAFIMKLETSLSLQCQRSWNVFNLPVHTEVKGVFTDSLALIKDLPADVEVYELEGGKVSPLEWIEEELLLCVPMAPIDNSSTMRYENDDDSMEVTDNEPAQAESVQKANPFAVLQGLKK